MQYSINDNCQTVYCIPTAIYFTTGSLYIHPFHPPLTLATNNLFSVSVKLGVWGLCFVLFCFRCGRVSFGGLFFLVFLWLSSGSTMLSGPSTLSQLEDFILFYFHCLYVSHFLCPSMHPPTGHLGCFCICAVVNNVAISMWVHTSFWVSGFG